MAKRSGSAGGQAGALADAIRRGQAQQPPPMKTTRPNLMAAAAAQSNRMRSAASQTFKTGPHPPPKPKPYSPTASTVGRPRKAGPRFVATAKLDPSQITDRRPTGSSGGDKWKNQ